MSFGRSVQLRHGPIKLEGKHALFADLLAVQIY